jgi:poly-D-alanine transfer protein DltD
MHQICSSLQNFFGNAPEAEQQQKPAAVQPEQKADRTEDADTRPGQKPKTAARIQQLSREKNMWRDRALAAEQAQHDAIKAAPGVEPAQNVDAAVARGQQRDAAQNAAQIEQEIWDARVEDARERHRDFEQIAYNKNVPYSDTMIANVRRVVPLPYC